MKLPNDFNLEKELAGDDAREIVDDSTLRRTKGYLPFVLSILEGVGVSIPSEKEIARLFLEHGERSGWYKDEVVLRDGAVLPANYPTLEYLRTLPEGFFGPRVTLYNSDLQRDVPFSLARIDYRIFIRCE
ncbi:MAG TPA: hypothetical protein HA360_02855 [Nanoarchaeota archaeon]|nr:hypothetical protein [Nanoarchaeota archaeon]HIH58989.1 hypothetical protein [Nanoarchaeota archaeon]HII13990.1 hypothetical protein [Nanoarchaeota archaeon]HIJ05484.1 hypothetical protein [Nanoarchaeota archaeon]